MTKITPRRGGAEILNGAGQTALFSDYVPWRPELRLITPAELAGLALAPPRFRPEVTDAGTEVAAALWDMAQTGALRHLSPFEVARTLRLPYDRFPQHASVPYNGFEMIAAADAADAIRTTVLAPPLAHQPIWTRRPMRLSARLAELSDGAVHEYYRRVRLTALLTELQTLESGAWVAVGWGGERLGARLTA